MKRSVVSSYGEQTPSFGNTPSFGSILTVLNSRMPAVNNDYHTDSVSVMSNKLYIGHLLEATLTLTVGLWQ